MAPQVGESRTLLTEQDAVDMKVNQIFLAFALGIAGLVVLGATAYVCYYVVGRVRKADVSAEVDDMKQPLRSLVLPGIVKEGSKSKGPKRLILSPNYPLPVYTNFEWVEDADDSTRRRSWFKAMRHSRDLSMSDAVMTRSMRQTEFVPPSMRRGLEAEKPTAMPSQQFPPDKDLADFTIGDASFMAEAATSYGNGSSEAPSTFSEKSSPMALSPEMIVNDLALPPPYAFSAEADSRFLNMSIEDEKACRDHLEVPAASWTAAREVSFFAEKPSESAELKTPSTANKRRSSFSKLVSALGDLSNVSRRFSKIDQDSAKTPRKNRPLASSTPRSKENARRSP